MYKENKNIMKTQGNDPAMPLDRESIKGAEDVYGCPQYLTGLTKREELAKAFMQSYIITGHARVETLLSKIKRLLGRKDWFVENHFNSEANAKSAVEAADALINELNKT